jgi:hypothetical protein
MNLKKITEKLKDLNIHFDKELDKEIEKAFCTLFQIIEDLSEENDKLNKEVQQLRDEINLLKGEQAKPNIKSSKKNENEDHSSEKERRKREPSKENKEPKSRAKNHKIKIDHTKYCKVNKEELPKDAKFKGYKSYIVQDIIIKTDNVEYKREVYYSPSEKKTYIGKLPEEVKGSYNPGVKSMAIVLKHIANVTEPKITEFFGNVGIYISQSTISRILTKKEVEVFHEEKANIFKAGLCSTLYQQIDDTSARVHGENHYAQIICNPYYTAYFTIPKKNRLSVLDILCGGKERSYLFNEEAFILLEALKVPKKVIAQLRRQIFGKELNNKQMKEQLKHLYPNPKKGGNQRTRIMEAGAIASYHAQTDFPVVSVLLSDDAPQFKLIVKEHALCWVHDGRHYKKIHPVVPQNQEKVDQFLDQYWDYYRELLEYKEHPSQEKASELSEKFDKLFSTQTNYKALDERIAKSKAKKEELLLVLKYPELPLHNNESELGARAQARKRDVSLHTITDEGTKAQDTFLTIAQTAKKLGVNVYKFIYDRISRKFQMPSLASLIPSIKSTDIEYCDTS